MRTFFIYWSLFSLPLIGLAIIILGLMLFRMMRERNKYSPVGLCITAIVYAAMCFAFDAWMLAVILREAK